jgi:hypothetical protein
VTTLGQDVGIYLDCYTDLLLELDMMMAGGYRKETKESLNMYRTEVRGKN